MRTVDLLRLVAALATVAATVLMASRRRLVRRFETGHAFDEHHALALAPPPAIDAWWQSRLERAGVLRHRADGHCWLDRDAWHRYRAVRRTRALVIVVVLLLALGIFMISGVR